MPLREVALPGEDGQGNYTARIGKVYVPWKPNEIRAIIADLPNIEKCPKKWYKKLMWIEKTQQATYMDMWILIDCAVPEKYVDVWNVFARKKGAYDQGIIKIEDPPLDPVAYEETIDRLNEILKDWVTTTFDKGQDMQTLMDVV